MPESAFPQLHPLGVKSRVMLVVGMDDWWARSKLELGVIHLYLFLSHGSLLPTCIRIFPSLFKIPPI